MSQQVPVRVFVVVNTASDDARTLARSVVEALGDAGAQVGGVAHDIESLDLGDSSSIEVIADDFPAGSAEADVVVVFGGDGTILRGAEVAAPGTPLLGVNLGHVGFLAEAEPEDVTFVVESLIGRRWEVEERTRLNVSLQRDGQQVDGTWALNEVSLEKASRERMINVLVEVDGRPLSRWGCDGVVCATPTGSTAYAFSAGGPVVWPEVAALLVVPLSAHALFARPLVVSPSSSISLDVDPGSAAVLWADGRRTIDVRPGDRLVVTADPVPVRFARLAPAPFTDRLVAKFDLPVEGWRGRQRS
ncbi:NAD kinase [Candidatus Nanopelagicales bacterium]|nr:NAD kinase [Candidatus Nanopelagicales bacterium]